jgi:hypothetical protein
MKQNIQEKIGGKGMKKNFFIQVMGLIIILPLICCGKCAMDYKYPIILKNNSDYSIDCYFALGGKYGIYYPNNLPDTNIYLIRGIKQKKDYYYDSSSKWDEVFSYLPSDTLSIYIFHTDTLTKYPWEEVRDKYMVLKRYDLSLSDLEKLKFNVPYPPSPAMSNMKMYPPYK